MDVSSIHCMNVKIKVGWRSSAVMRERVEGKERKRMINLVSYRLSAMLVYF